MLLEPVDPNEEFRERRRRSRRRRARRRIAVLTVFAVSAAAIALGASFLNGRGHQATAQPGSRGPGRRRRDDNGAPTPSLSRSLTRSGRSRHDGASPRSNGKLRRVFAAPSAASTRSSSTSGRERRGRVQRGVPLRGTSAPRSANTTAQPQRAEANASTDRPLVVFEDPKLSVAPPGMASGAATGASGRTTPARVDEPVRQARLEVQRRHRRRGGEGGLRRDHVRLRPLPTDGDLASAVFKGRRRSTRA